MQITIDIDDNKVASQILDILKPFKKKEGIKIATPKDNEIYSPKKSQIKPNINQETDSLDAKFKNILGKYAKERCNVSIGEDRKVLQDALWQKYGQ